MGSGIAYSFLFPDETDEHRRRGAEHHEALDCPLTRMYARSLIRPIAAQVLQRS